MEAEQGECKPTSKIIAGLQQYDPEEVQREFKRLEEQTLILSEEEFHRAVYASMYHFIEGKMSCVTIIDSFESEVDRSVLSYTFIVIILKSRFIGRLITIYIFFIQLVNNLYFLQMTTRLCLTVCAA